MSVRVAANELAAGTPQHEAFRAYASLTTEKRDLNERLSEVEQELKALEPQLLAYMGEGGYQLVKILGYTISPHREPWVYPRQGITRDTVCRALKACGLAHYVSENFNTRSLTKYVRDLEEQHQLLIDAEDAMRELLPEELIKVIEVKPTYRIQALRR